MTAGRPRRADPGTLYAFAHQFYFDFRRLAEGSFRWRLDKKKYDQLAAEADKVQLSDDQKSHLRKYVEQEILAGRVKEAVSNQQ